MFASGRQDKMWCCISLVAKESCTASIRFESHPQTTHIICVRIVSVRWLITQSQWEHTQQLSCIEDEETMRKYSRRTLRGSNSLVHRASNTYSENALQTRGCQVYQLRLYIYFCRKIEVLEDYPRDLTVLEELARSLC